MGYRIFDGKSWSPVLPTNIRTLYGGLTVTFDQQGRRFDVFSFDINPFNSTIVTEWSGKIGSSFYANSTLVDGRNELYAITSFEASIRTSIGPDTIGVAWTETGHFPYRVYVYTGSQLNMAH